MSTNKTNHPFNIQQVSNRLSNNHPSFFVWLSGVSLQSRVRLRMMSLFMSLSSNLRMFSFTQHLLLKSLHRQMALKRIWRFWNVEDQNQGKKRMAGADPLERSPFQVLIDKTNLRKKGGSKHRLPKAKKKKTPACRGAHQTRPPWWSWKFTTPAKKRIPLICVCQTI